VPSPWQAQFTDLHMRAGIGIYRRDVNLRESWLRDRVWMRFGAVFHNTKLWVNGELIGTNEGGFLPFSFDVTDALKPGRNEIKVRVDSPTDNPNEFPDSPFAEIPFGKQSWYGPLSGIWQSVHLERRIADHMRRIRLVPDRETGTVEVELQFMTALAGDAEFAVRVTDPGGAPVVQAGGSAAAGAETLPLSFKVEDPRSWSPDEPNLYRARVEMRRGGQVVDTIEDNFGFARSRPATARSTSTASRSTFAPRWTRTITPTRSAPCPRWTSWRTSSARPRSLASTACAATSRRPTRAITRSPTGSAS
jgi:beta-galactosidase/beta-glucuronidase